MKKHTCEVNVDRDEPTPCRKPATWYAEDYRASRLGGFWLCEKHQREVAQRCDDDLEWEELAR